MRWSNPILIVFILAGAPGTAVGVSGGRAALPAPPAPPKPPLRKVSPPPQFPPAAAAHLPRAKPNALSIVQQSITIHGKALPYTVTTGYMPLKNGAGKLQADIFFIAYTKNTTAARRDHRPLTFCFNGGPGAASNWLNLGCAGPFRVQLTPKGNVTPPPYKLVPNHQTWLTATDLVFVDPVGTGYSRLAPGVPGKRFYGVVPDVKSIADFIRLYTTMYQRWGSPLFLAGESYGTTRACALADYLGVHEGMALNGIMLISCALNFQLLSPNPGNDTPYPLFLPTYTATAWYYHKLPGDLEKHFHRTLAKVEHWALGDYLTALAHGASLPPAQREKISAAMARYTGLSKRYILLSNLRVGPGHFEQALLRNQKRVIGRMDTRLSAYNPNPTAGTATFDPSLSRFLAPFTSAFNEYVRKDLKYANNLPYQTLSEKVFPWNFGPGGAGFLYVTDNLRRAMIRNPYMKVLVCSGYFDLATPFFGTVYTMNHLNLSRKLQSNIQEVFFRGGHMVYHPAPMRKKLAAQVRTFIRRASGAKPRLTAK